MKVDDRNLTGPAPPGAERATETQRADRSVAPQPEPPAASADSASLSALAGRVSRALSSSNAQRAARIQELAALYQSGKYEPEPTALARRLVSDVLSTGKTE